MTTLYWNPGLNNAYWDDATIKNWATTYNGAPSVQTPTSNDDCIFTAYNVFNCRMLSIGDCNNLYFDNSTNGGYGDYTGQFSKASQSIRIYGNLSLSSGMTVRNIDDFYFYFAATSGTKTITTRGVNVYSVLFGGNGGTFQLQDDLTCSRLVMNNAGSTLDIGNHTVSFTGYGTGVTMLYSSGAFTANTGTYKIIVSGNGNATFAGGGKTYNNIWWARGTSTGSNIITGSNTFNDFKDDGSVAHSLLFTKSTTTTVATWNVNGTGGGGSVRTILDTVDGAGTFTLHGTGTTLSCDWLDIRRSTVDASPKWYAGANSLNTASNTNWIFTAPPVLNNNAGIMNFFNN